MLRWSFPDLSVNKDSKLLIDDFGRVANYLRLSVTDRCNLRCTYCQSEVIHKFIPHKKILRYEELLQIVSAAITMGIKKIRLTGGEPFVRKGFMSFLQMLHEQFPEVDLHITSNGTLLKPHIKSLHELGVRGINISLDTFDRKTFERTTQCDALLDVLENIDALLSMGMQVKINAVAMRAVIDKELEVFMDYAMKNPVDVRFIEFMPMGSNTVWDEMSFISAEEIYQKAIKYSQLTQDNDLLSNDLDQLEHKGPARMYKLNLGLGRLGFITAVSNHFCNTCNRLRVTSEGNIRTCLFADAEYSLLGILRNTKLCDKKKEKYICKVMLRSMRLKPMGEAFLKARNAAWVAKKNMVSIGG